MTRLGFELGPPRWEASRRLTAWAMPRPVTRVTAGSDLLSHKRCHNPEGCHINIQSHTNTKSLKVKTDMFHRPETADVRSRNCELSEPWRMSLRWAYFGTLHPPPALPSHHRRKIRTMSQGEMSLLQLSRQSLSQRRLHLFVQSVHFKDSKYIKIKITHLYCGLLGRETVYSCRRIQTYLSSFQSWRSEWMTYSTTDGQSASLSWCLAPMWGLWPDFYYSQTIAGLSIWGDLSDERTGLSFLRKMCRLIFIHTTSYNCSCDCCILD
jgi:hypothetical protein